MAWRIQVCCLILALAIGPSRANAQLAAYVGPIRGVYFSPDNGTLATLAWNSERNEAPPWGGMRKARAIAGVEVKLWNISDGREKASWLIPGAGILNAVVAADLATIAVLSKTGDKHGDGILQIFDVSSRKLRHQHVISYHASGLKFSPDGQRLLFAAGMAASLWDVPTGKKLGDFGANKYAISACAFAPDGKSIVCGSDREVIICGPGEGRDDKVAWGDLKLYDSNRLQVQLEVQDPTAPAFSGGVKFADFLPTGNAVVAISGADVRMWDTKRGQLVGTLLLSSGDNTKNPIYRVTACAVSADGQWLAVGCIHNNDASNYQIHVWEIAAGKRLTTLHGHTENVRTLAFSPDGRFLASGGERVQLWQLIRPEVSRLQVKVRSVVKGHHYFLSSVAFAPDGKTLASAAQEGTVKLWDVASMREQAVLKPPSDQGLYEFTSVTFSHDGKRLITGGGTQTEYGEAVIWDLTTRAVQQRLRGHGSVVMAVAESKDGTRLATSGWDGKLVLWDLKTGQMIDTCDSKKLLVNSSPYLQQLDIVFHDKLPRDIIRNFEELEGCTAFARTADGRILAAGDEHRQIHLWDVAAATRIGMNAGQAEFNSLRFSADGTLLAAGGRDGSVRMWDRTAPPVRAIVDAENPIVIKGHHDSVWGLAFSRDGQTLATGSQDGEIRVWDLRRAPKDAATPLADLWQALGDADPISAHQARIALIQLREQAPEYFAARLKPAADPAERIKHLIQRLDDPAFEVRDAASRDLQLFGFEAEPALQQALDKGPSLEVKLRIERLLSKLAAPSPILAEREQRQAVRAIHVLRHIGTPEARRLVARLAEGAAGSAQTTAARWALGAWQSE